MNTVKAAVFDLGNVLLHWDPDTYYDSLFGAQRRRAFFAEVPIEDINRRSDYGESLAEMVAELAADFPAWSREIRTWSDDWLKICSPAIEDSVRLLERLKARGVPLFTLTNFGDETFEIARAAYPFLDLFDAHFVSARLRVMKPDPDIYAALEAGTGMAGADLLFADDRAENVEAAAARGWQTHHFRDAAGWEQALVKAGLLDSCQ